MTSSTKAQPVSVKILGKDYRIACSEDEKATLIDSAHELDEQMRKIRDSGSVIGTDRIAIIAALNLTHELHQARSTRKPSKDGISTQLANLRHKIELVLENQLK